MTKDEAIKKMIERDFNAIPQEWVHIVMEKKEEYHALPMWGTMWLVESFIGEKLKSNSKIVCEPSECYNHDKNTTCDICEDWEEMGGENNLKDKDGRGTAVYVYDIDGQYLIGIHGVGYDFYHGVWDKIYDVLGLEWHDEEKNKYCTRCGYVEAQSGEKCEKCGEKMTGVI